MKIFNKGGRSFKLFGLELPPDKSTEIPDDPKYLKHAAKLLADYPNELIEGGAPAAEVAAIKDASKKLDLENRQLRTQVANLQALLTAPVGQEAALLERAMAADSEIDRLKAELETANAKLASHAVPRPAIAEPATPAAPDAQEVQAPKKAPKK